MVPKKVPLGCPFTVPQIRKEGHSIVYHIRKGVIFGHALFQLCESLEPQMCYSGVLDIPIDYLVKDLKILKNFAYKVVDLQL